MGDIFTHWAGGCKQEEVLQGHIGIALDNIEATKKKCLKIKTS